MCYRALGQALVVERWPLGYWLCELPQADAALRERLAERMKVTCEVASGRVECRVEMPCAQVEALVQRVLGAYLLTTPSHFAWRAPDLAKAASPH